MKEVIKTTRWDYTPLILKRSTTVYEVYSTDSAVTIKTFKRRKHAKKFAKR
jgi:hypothetical protein